MAVVVKHGVEPIGARIYASPIVTTTTTSGTSDQQFSDSSDHKLCKWFCVKRTSNLLRIHILSNKKLQHFFIWFITYSSFSTYIATYKQTYQHPRQSMKRRKRFCHSFQSQLKMGKWEIRRKKGKTPIERSQPSQPWPALLLHCLLPLLFSAIKEDIFKRFSPHFCPWW